MKHQINYIFRKRLPQYHSIEELFHSISKEMELTNEVNSFELPFSGASPLVLLKNLLSIKKRDNQIYHITGDVNYMCLRFWNCSVLTIHDVKSAYRGSWLKKNLIKYIWFVLPAKGAKYITVISEFTKGEILELIPRQAHKIRVVYNPIHELIKPDLRNSTVSKIPKILLIGTKPNKNLERSIKAMRSLNVELTIVGRLTPDQVTLLRDHKLNYKNVASLSFEEVVDCYKECDILCFPSTYEGFGMPIIEAQGIGRPVLTSNLGAMKEIAGNGACLVDPYDVNSIYLGIKKIIEDGDYRDQLIRQGLNNTKRFKLNRIAQTYADLYKLIN